MFTTRQSVRIHCPYGRRPQNVDEFATIIDWCTDGWHRTKLELYNGNRIVTDKSVPRV